MQTIYVSVLLQWQPTAKKRTLYPSTLNPQPSTLNPTPYIICFRVGAVAAGGLEANPKP